MERYYANLGLTYTRDSKKAANAIRGFSGKHGFLSNFGRHAYEFKGERFHSSEQGYMWEKSDKLEYRRNVMRAATAMVCKRVGRTAVLKPDWDSVRRYRAMYEHVLAKFRVPYMTERLLATGEAYLEETNYHGDTHWGVCRGVGENHLGRILMCVRYQLRMERKKRGRK